jgi:S-adenosylmethionine:tRNA ribosyltransferase-isomerase
MRVDEFVYELPPELIAQRPAEDRELARLLVVGGGDPDGGAGEPGDAIEHHRVGELPDLLPEGALVVVNDTRVIPARLLGRKRDTRGRVEVLLVRKTGVQELEIAPDQIRGVEIWRALGKSSKPLKFGADIEIPGRGSGTGGADARDAEPAVLFVRLLGRSEDDGLLEVAVWSATDESVEAGVRACGHVPLPPYIKRDDEADDVARYQTVYARHDGAVAAPTAGLHVTNAMIGRLAVRGCDVASVTLHVGLGTFQPVTVEDLDQHPMHSERYVVTPSTVEAIARARARGKPVVAVGTTTVRALESAADPDRPGHVLPASGETRLLIQPGHAWRVVDVLLTNFHLPRSTLLALTCAFGGRDRVLAAYRAAVQERYRFFSYGDAMLLRRGG